MMRILHISDTHGFHRDLQLPEADVIIHSGDVSNSLDPAINANEILDFVGWFAQLPAQFKIFVPGNHDFALNIGYVRPDDFKNAGIHLLINEEIEIDEVKFWGSPYTPRLYDHYTSWAWGLRRGDMDKAWSLIPPDTDVLITHGPPLGVLDLCSDHNDRDKPVQAGDKILLNHIRKVKPKMHLFGHIHDEKSYINSGVFSKHETIFSNGSCAGGSKLELRNHGNLLGL